MMVQEVAAQPWLAGEPPGPAKGGVFIAWRKDCFRSLTSARCLGVDLWLIAPFDGKSTVRKVARYIASFAITVGMLYARRPPYVFAYNQPLPLLVAMSLYTVPFRVPFMLDGHSSAFSPSRAKPLRQIYAWFTRKALFTVNHNRKDQAVVQAWGGRSELIPEIAGEVAVPAGMSKRPQPTVMVVCSFAKGDEPVHLVWEAARDRPDIRYMVTGDHRRAPQELLADLPANVTLTGFIPRQTYLETMATADVVVTLSTRSQIMQTAAEEALSLGVPLIANKSPILEEVFEDDALFIDLTPEALARAVDTVVSDQGQWRARMAKRRAIRRDTLRQALARIQDTYFPRPGR